jgi:hypothetical protein
MNDYISDLHINKYMLDEEWESHQDKFMEYASAYSEAIRIRDDAKELLSFKRSEAQEVLDIIRSELDAEIRSNPTSFGYDKLTEAIVTSWITRQIKYQAAMSSFRNTLSEYSKKLNEAEYEVNVLKGVKEAFEHRKTAMDNLTRLFLAGYFSSKPSKDVRESVKENREEKREESTKTKLNESFRRRKEVKNGEKS